jgi:hypothetical protein
MPQKATHQIAMTALRKSAPASGSFGARPLRRGRAAAIAARSARTASTKASTSVNASHGAGVVVAERIVVPMAARPGCCWCLPPI